MIDSIVYTYWLVTSLGDIRLQVISIVMITRYDYKITS